MPHYNLRSSAAPPSPHTAPGYQPPAPSSISSVENSISAVTSTLDGLLPLLDSLKPASDFEIGIGNVARLLIGHMKEMKLELHELKQLSHRSFRAIDGSMTDLTTAVVKQEQYSRRDMVTVAGIPQPTDEKQESLAAKVATQLSLSGESVTPDDFSVIHRNGRAPREVKGKKIPPTITVKFAKLSKKDSVLRGYKNFDPVAQKPREAKVFQSLSPHYASFRRKIVEFFDSTNSSANFGKQLKWATYQSPTAGLVVNLKTGEYLRDIHVWDDFITKFRGVVNQ